MTLPLTLFSLPFETNQVLEGDRMMCLHQHIVHLLGTQTLGHT